MSENFRSENSVEISLTTKWWFGLLYAFGMPIFLFLPNIIDPTFISFKEDKILIICIVFSSVVSLVISLLCRKIIKRFSLDSSVRSLVFEVFWSGVRVFKRTYPFETIDKFDLLIKNESNGQYSIKKIEVLALVFQSGKVKYLTGYNDRYDIKNWAIQLNNLLQDQGGFPAERFTKPLRAHWPAEKQNTFKILLKMTIIVFSIFTVVILIALLMLGFF